MAAHHEQGIEVATIASQQVQNPHLRALARLMAAEQSAEVRIFHDWWRSWFNVPFEVCSADEIAEMPGMLSPGQLHLLRKARGRAFDPLFIELMSFHHAGAVEMADEELRGSGDIRLRVMAQAVRHGQQGEIAMMQGAQGLSRRVGRDEGSLRSADVGPGPLEEGRRRPLAELPQFVWLGI